MSIRRTQSSRQSWLVLLLFAACCAVRVETLAVYGSIGTTNMEANALSSKYVLSQDALCCFHSLPHCSVSTTMSRKNSVCSSQPHWTLFKRKSFLVMGKGDGKKRRKKKSPTIATTTMFHANNNNNRLRNEYRQTLTFLYVCRFDMEKCTNKRQNKVVLAFVKRKW